MHCTVIINSDRSRRIIMQLYKNFCTPTVNENGLLTDFKLNVPENYNFGYDVVDKMAELAAEAYVSEGYLRALFQEKVKLGRQITALQNELDRLKNGTQEDDTEEEDPRIETPVCEEEPETVVTATTNEPLKDEQNSTIADKITAMMPADAKEVTTEDSLRETHAERIANETKNIDLNHYTETALNAIYNNVVDIKEDKLTSQPAFNAAAAAICQAETKKYDANVRRSENKAPSVKVYDTSERVRGLAGSTLTADKSAIGRNYNSYSSSDGGNYTYAGKWAHLEPNGVDYYIYTNSARPVIAVELDDGAVAATAAGNNSSYPTNAAVTAANNDPNAKYDADGAVAATNDIQKAWFAKYTKAGIGTGIDYNKKAVIYLTPDFTSSNASATNNEVVYNIIPTDDAYNSQGKSNEGVSTAALAGSEQAANQSLSSYKYSVNDAGVQQIKIAIFYHNSMNGNSDMGGAPDDAYLQMYTDQVMADTWLKQMHLFRTAGGASNWELPVIGDSIYKIVDQTYPNGELGSFAYIFNPSEIPGFSTSDDETAKNAVINKISQDISGTQVAITDKNDPRHYSSEKGLGFFAVNNWSTNFYPKQGTYVYAHLVEERTGKQVSRMHLYYTGEDKGEPIITFEKSKESIEATIKTFDNVVDKIQKHEFNTIAQNKKTCQNCDMRYYCGKVSKS